MRWRAFLYPEGALVVNLDSGEWHAAARSRFAMECAETLGIPPDVLFRTHFGHRQRLIEIQPEDQERFRAWKQQ